MLRMCIQYIHTYCVCRCAYSACVSTVHVCLCMCIQCMCVYSACVFVHVYTVHMYVYMCCVCMYQCVLSCVRACVCLCAHQSQWNTLLDTFITSSQVSTQTEAIFMATIVLLQLTNQTTGTSSASQLYLPPVCLTQLVS